MVVWWLCTEQSAKMYAAQQSKNCSPSSCKETTWIFIEIGALPEFCALDNNATELVVRGSFLRFEAVVQLARKPSEDSVQFANNLQINRCNCLQRPADFLLFRNLQVVATCNMHVIQTDR